MMVHNFIFIHLALINLDMTYFIMMKIMHVILNNFPWNRQVNYYRPCCLDFCKKWSSDWELELQSLIYLKVFHSSSNNRWAVWWYFLIKINNKTTPVVKHINNICHLDNFMIPSVVEYKNTATSNTAYWNSDLVQKCISCQEYG